MLMWSFAFEFPLDVIQASGSSHIAHAGFVTMVPTISVGNAWGWKLQYLFPLKCCEMVTSLIWLKTKFLRSKVWEGPPGSMWCKNKLQGVKYSESVHVCSVFSRQTPEGATSQTTGRLWESIQAVKQLVRLRNRWLDFWLHTKPL